MAMFSQVWFVTENMYKAQFFGLHFEMLGVT